MITHTHIYYDWKELYEFITARNLISQKNLLIQIFTTINDRIFIKMLIDQLKSALPQAVLIGGITNGTIVNNKSYLNSTTMNFSVFEDSYISSYYAMKTDFNNDKDLGKKLAEELIHKDTKILILYSCAGEICTNEVLNGIGNINSNTLVCGGQLLNKLDMKESYVFIDNKIIQNGVVAISLNSEKLKVYLEHNCGWQPIGNYMTVTNSLKNEVLSLNGNDVKQIYKKYFGIEINNQALKYLIEYPLWISKSDLKLLRYPIEVSYDGIKFNGDIHKGEKVRFSFSNNATIYRVAENMFKNYSNNKIQSAFIFFSSKRHQIMGGEINHEISFYDEISKNLCGLFTDGEIYHSKDLKKNVLLTNSATILFLTESSEDTYEDELHNEFSNESLGYYLEDKVSETIDIFSHFINVVSDEIDQSLDELVKSQSAIIERDRLAAIGQLMGGLLTI